MSKVIHFTTIVSNLMYVKNNNSKKNFMEFIFSYV